MNTPSALCVRRACVTIRRRVTRSLPHHDLPAVEIGRDCDFRAGVHRFVHRDVDDWASPLSSRKLVAAMIATAAYSPPRWNECHIAGAIGGVS